MKYLTLNEEILLLTIWRLKDNAYGVAIRDLYVETTGKSIVLGTMYNSLDYLVKKRYVTTRKAESTPERGGRGKTYFEITDLGLEALKRTRELHNSIWQDIPDTIFNV